MPAKRDYYEILGITREADAEEIKRAYRKLAMKYHPDRNAHDEEATQMFKEISEAYAVLSDADKRARYDRYGHAGLEGMAMPDFGNADSIFDLFGDLFGEMFGGTQRRGPRPGRDLGCRVQIDLVEAYRGAKKEVTIPRQENCDECNATGARRGTSPSICHRCNGHGAVLLSQGFFRMQQTCGSCGGRGTVISDPCPKCRGSGRVTVKRTLDVHIPAGAFSGLQLMLRGEGEAGQPSAPRGDLIVEILVKDHPLFQRDGDNLICQVPITFSQAALGATIDVPTLEGPVPHNIPAGIQSGEAVRIRGKGMPNVRSGRKGDVIVLVIVETPRQLTKRQEELLRELAELDHKNVSPQRKSFFDRVREFFTGSEATEQNGEKKEQEQEQEQASHEKA